MLEFNGLYFVDSPELIVDSLFSPINGKTASGYYVIKSNGVLLYDVKNEPRIFLVANKYNEFFAVSVSVHNGQIRYMHSTCSIDEKWLGLDAMGYADAREAIEKAVKSTGKF